MRSLEQIIADNGYDNTPALDTHNLTGRVVLDPYDVDEPLTWDTDDPIDSYEHWLGRLDCE